MAAARNPNEVGIFVYRAGRHLVLHRVDRGVWHIAAGVVKEGESFPTAARRELREETGLDLPPVDLEIPLRYLIEEGERARYAPGTTHVLVHSFAVEAPAGWEPALNHEHDAYRWATLEEAGALLHWPEAREALTHLARRIGTI